MALELLPFDILISILSFLGPKEILHLRKTCRNLHAASQARTVWLTCLHHICATQGMFLPTFPLEDMSIAQIEHAVLSPSLLSARIKKSPENQVVLPARTQVLGPGSASTSSESGESDPPACLQVCLVPGGRYLFARFAQPNGLSLWDLGLNAMGPAASSPLAVVEGPYDGIISTTPTPDGLGIRFCTYFNSSGNTNVSIQEFYPSKAEKGFERLGALELKGILHIHSHYMQLFIALDHFQHVTVWDYHENMSTTWQLESIAQEVLIVGEQIVLFNVEEISVWEIPPLSRQANNSILHQEVIRHSPRFVFNHIYAALTRHTAFSVPSPWWPASARDFYVGLVNPARQTPAMYFYQFDQSTQLEYPYRDTSNPSHAGRVLSLPDNLDCRTLFGLRLCENDFCQRWQLHTDVMISLIPIPSSREERYTAITRSMHSDDMMDFDFCSASGRLAVATATGQIRILDFLPPARSV